MVLMNLGFLDSTALAARYSLIEGNLLELCSVETVQLRFPEFSKPPAI